MQPSVVVFLALLAVPSLASDFKEVNFKDCKSTSNVKKVEVIGGTIVEMKDGVKGMELKPGTEPTLRITFTPSESGLNDLKTAVRAKVGGAMLPYSLEKFQTCEHGGVKCPLEAGVEQTYMQSMPMQASYPKNEEIQVNWQITVGDKKVVCVVFVAKLTDE